MLTGELDRGNQVGAPASLALRNSRSTSAEWLLHVRLAQGAPTSILVANVTLHETSD